MVKKPLSTGVSYLRHWGPSQLRLLTRHLSSLPRHRVALTTAAAATLLAGAALALGPGWRDPTAAPTPTPAARAALTLQARQAASQPGYLPLRGGASPPEAQPQVSSRGGARPTTAPPTPTATPTSTPTPDPKEIRTYTVAAGDTVAGLAERFGVSAETIVWANNLPNGGASLQAGQELTILPLSGVLHKVRRGETLNGIAQAYGVGAEAIIEANALDDADALSVDQALIIPGGQPLPPPTPRPTAAPPAPAAAPEASPPATVNPDAAGKGAEIVAIAARYIGYSYVYAGNSPATGFDCSGFTQWVYGQAGISLPHATSAQVAAGPAVLRSALLPGDLIFFQGTYRAGISHVGIYVGDGRMIHAANPQAGVRYDSIDDPYWVAHYYGSNRPWQ